MFIIGGLGQILFLAPTDESPNSFFGCDPCRTEDCPPSRRLSTDTGEMAPKFQIADYVVFAISIIASLSIGIYFSFSGHRPQTNKQYLTGDGRLHVIPVAISLVVSFVSTIGILGNPAEVYAYGTQYMWYLFAMVIGILAGTFLFVPLYYPLKYTRMRFHARYLEYFVVMLALLNMASYSFLDTRNYLEVLYTSHHNDRIHTAQGTLEVGSVHEVWEINKQWNRVVVPEIDPTIRMTFWSVCVTNPLLWMMLIGSQSSVQRFVSLSSLRSAKLSTILTIPGFLFSGSLACVTGVTAFAYYAKKGCDPLSSGTISSPNQSTTVAAIIGLAVSGWIGVGTTLNKVRDPVLPGPVHNCSILDPGAATTMSSLNNSFTESRIPWFYSVSYFYFPIVGLLTVFVVSIMALPFPCLRPPIKTQKRFLFPCLRRYFGAPDDPDSLDQEPEEKPLDSKSEQMEIEETKQAEQMPAENDVWRSRDDDKMAAGNGELAAEPNYPSKYTHQDYY
ncbi:hypothetical protein LSH36_274g05017 [Paralvinella palmiformis]|uniref:Uncharacterized protein n=1 Tax=Paralvinella palmiformis TaxID=53620 RepID=A0AAD9N3M5_9ANNE|nr:hypothetical protein LSH36_274g05017 [Paralvinella palmiformis]